MSQFLRVPKHMGNHIRFWHLSGGPPAIAQTSLHICCSHVESMEVNEGSDLKIDI